MENMNNIFPLAIAGNLICTGSNYHKNVVLPLERTLNLQWIFTDISAWRKTSSKVHHL